MNKYKQSLLSLCLLFLFSVGYLSVGSLKTFAYSGDNSGEYPIKWRDNVNVYLTLRESDYNTWTRYVPTYDSNKNIFYANNPALTDITYISYENTTSALDFNFMPELYDYYFFGTVSAIASSSAQFSFVPNRLYFSEKNCTEGWRSHYLEEMKVYHHDDNNSIGFSVFGRFPDNFHNTNIIGFHFENQTTGLTVPANIEFEGLVIAVDKNSDISGITSALEKINNSINNQGNSIQDAVDQAREDIEIAIEDQYSIDSEEDFGINDITDNVESKMGVLTFTSDTLVSFLDLFSGDVSGGTELTFPGFSISLVNERATYQVWPDIKYDLKELETQFRFLINTVRSITVLCVWLALFRYLGRAYEHFINKR